MKKILFLSLSLMFVGISGAGQLCAMDKELGWDHYVEDNDSSCDRCDFHIRAIFAKAGELLKHMKDCDDAAAERGEDELGSF